VAKDLRRALRSLVNSIVSVDSPGMNIGEINWEPLSERASPKSLGDRIERRAFKGSQSKGLGVSSMCDRSTFSGTC